MDIPNNPGFEFQLNDFLLNAMLGKRWIIQKLQVPFFQFLLNQVHSMFDRHSVPYMFFMV